MSLTKALERRNRPGSEQMMINFPQRPGFTTGSHVSLREEQLPARKPSNLQELAALPERQAARPTTASSKIGLSKSFRN